MQLLSFRNTSTLFLLKLNTISVLREVTLVRNQGDDADVVYLRLYNNRFHCCCWGRGGGVPGEFISFGKTRFIKLSCLVLFCLVLLGFYTLTISTIPLEWSVYKASFVDDCTRSAFLSC